MRNHKNTNNILHSNKVGPSTVDGAQRAGDALTRVLVTVDTDITALVGACRAGLSAYLRGQPDAWRWIAEAVPRLPKRVPSRAALESNADLLAHVAGAYLDYMGLVAACWSALRAGLDGDPGAWDHISAELVAFTGDNLEPGELTGDGGGAYG